MFGSLIVAFWSVGDQEPAVIKLVSHFRHVIANIVVGNHKELPATGVITSDLVKRKKKRYFFTAADCEHLWATKQNTKALWLGNASLKSLLPGLRNKVCHKNLITTSSRL